MNDMEKRYRIDELQFFYDYSDGLAIIINSTTGVYYGINTFGSAIFNQLVKGVSPASVLKELRHLSGCPLEIEDIFVNFITRLQNFGLLIPETTVEGNKMMQSFDQSIATEGFVFEVEEFAEIQEILLADPIHDVNNDHGWPILFGAANDFLSE